MEINIKKKEKKPLVEREEIEALVIQDYTPSNSQVQEELAKLFKKDKELVVVKHIYSRFGSFENNIFAYIYDNKEALKKFEVIKEKKEEKQKEETKTEEKKEKREEKKAKEKQEEKKEKQKEKQQEEKKGEKVKENK